MEETTFQLKLEDPGTPSFASTVVDILNATLPQNASKAPEEAASAIDELLNQHYSEHGTAGGFLWWFWDLVHDLSRQVPAECDRLQQRLAETIKALQDLPPRTARLGEEWGQSDGSVQIWAELPLFADTFRETLTDGMLFQASLFLTKLVWKARFLTDLRQKGDARADGEIPRKQRQINLQAYGARVAGLCRLPFEMYAIWALVDALEGTVKPIRGAPDEVTDDPAAVEDLPCKTRIAASWMIHAGHFLYGRDEHIRGATAGPLWRVMDKQERVRTSRALKGTDGLSLERWILWKNRFGVIQHREGLDEQLRELAGQAVQAMQAVEQRKQSIISSQ